MAYLSIIGPSQNNPSKDRETVARKLIEQIGKIRNEGNEENFFAIMGDFNVVPSDNPNGVQDVLLSRQSGMVDVESTFRQDRSISLRPERVDASKLLFLSTRWKLESS